MKRLFGVRKKKKLVVFAIEKKGHGVMRVNGKVIQHSSAKEFGKFMKRAIDLSAETSTDQWVGYTPIKGILRT